DCIEGSDGSHPSGYRACRTPPRLVVPPRRGFQGAEGVGSFRRFPNPPTWAEFAVAAGLWAGFPRLLPVGQLSYLLLPSLAIGFVVIRQPQPDLRHLE